MTKSVIMFGAMKNPVVNILAKWPDRQALYADALAADPDLNMVAVHRWFQRGSVPAKYWAALITGAKMRQIELTAEDVVAAHAAAADQDKRGAA